MKRIVSLILCAALTLVLLATLTGCGTTSENDDRISIVATVFPQYDWVRQIIGEENMDRFNLTLLVDSGVDLHSFNPTVSDIATITSADVFIYVGGHSDNWVERVISQAENEDMIVVNLMEALGEENIIRDIHALCADPDCDDEHDYNEELPADEHFWMSLSRAAIVSELLADMLAEVDSENAEVYRENMRQYVAQLSSLDDEFRAVVGAASGDTIVVADRFPFRYLVDDYDLNHFAAFPGCTAAMDVPFSVIISLANRLNQLGVGAVLVTESSDKFIARTIIENTTEQNQEILVLNAVQSVTRAQIQDGLTYLGIMQENLEVLREALG